MCDRTPTPARRRSPQRSPQPPRSTIVRRSFPVALYALCALSSSPDYTTQRRDCLQNLSRTMPFCVDMRRPADICSCLLRRATIAIEVHHMKTRKAHLLLAVVAGVLFVGLFAASVARA